MARIAAVLVVIGAALAASPVQAQFGSDSSNAPPRPPADIPNGPFPVQPPPVQYPGQYPSPQQYPAEQQYPAQQQYPAAQQKPPQRQNPPVQSSRGPYSIQGQPLPPPPGASIAPAAPNRGNATSPTPPQGAAASPPPANAGAPQQADTSPPVTSPGQEDDTTVIETPTEKIENGRAVFAGLDKITGRTIKFDAAVGETVQFGALQVTARACYTRPPTEPTNTDAFVEVDEVTLKGEIKRIFTGWMFAASPGLHAVEHPIYDVWLTDCASPPSPAPVAQSTPPTPPAAAAGAQPPGQQRAPRQPLTPTTQQPKRPAIPAIAPSNPAPATDD